MSDSPIKSAFPQMKPSMPLPPKLPPANTPAPPLPPKPPANDVAASKPSGAPGVVAGDSTTTEPLKATTEANRPPPKPVALYTVVVTLCVVPELPKGEVVRIRSKLGEAGERVIELSLNSGHILVSRSLKRADTLLVRFLLCMALAEYVGFWRGRHDGQILKEAITTAAGIEPENFWGLTLASKLAGSELLRSLDSTLVFGPAPSEEVFELFKLTVQLREYSDIPNWRPKREGVANA
jgi:hypothetical protein